jgi:hypothetical protein
MMVSHSAARVSSLRRSTWTALGDDALLTQCEVDTYRASGPGGQKRNKTSSAVRLRHLPSGLIVIAEESRSQHENKARALRRLRKALYLELREEIPVQALVPDALRALPEFRRALGADGKLHCTAKNASFWPAVGVVLDVLEAMKARVSETAELLGVSTGNLVGFLEEEPKVWQQANSMRARNGLKQLKT